MNNIFKVIWNHSTQSWAVVSELSRSKGKTKSKLTAVAVAVSLGLFGAETFAAAVDTNPNGNSVLTTDRDTILIGKGAASHNTRPTPIQGGPTETGYNSIVIGENSTIRASETIVLGTNATVGKPPAITTNIGFTNNTVVIGNEAKAGTKVNYDTTDMVAIGYNSTVNFSGGVAVGAHSVSNGTSLHLFRDNPYQPFSVDKTTGAVSGGYLHPVTNKLIGLAVRENPTNGVKTYGVDTNSNGIYDSSANSDDTAATALGHKAYAQGGAAAVGSYAVARTSAVALGSLAIAEGSSSTAIGMDTFAKGNTAIAIGRGSAAAEDYGIAMGNTAASGGIGSIAMGHSALASDYRSVAIGSSDIFGAQYTFGTTGVQLGSNYNGKSQTVASAQDATAIGGLSQATGVQSTALGASSYALAKDSSAIGFDAKADNEGATAIGSGSYSHGISSAAIADDSLALADKSLALGSNTKALANDTIAIGSNAIAGISTMTPAQKANIENAQNTLNTKRDELANAVTALKEKAEELKAAGGSATKAQKDAYDQASRNYQTALEAVNTAKSDLLNIIKALTSGVDSQDAIAIGKNSVASAPQALAVGVESKVTAEKSGVFGYNSTVPVTNTFVVGNNVNATQANSVILGNNSTDRAATTVSSATINGITYGDRTAGTKKGFAGQGSAANGVVSVGDKGKERQIINVAAGNISATSTDAINGSQLYLVTANSAWKIWQGKYEVPVEEEGPTFINTKIDDVKSGDNVFFHSGNATIVSVELDNDGTEANTTVRYDVNYTAIGQAFPITFMAGGEQAFLQADGNYTTADGTSVTPTHIKVNQGNPLTLEGIKGNLSQINKEETTVTAPNGTNTEEPVNKSPALPNNIENMKNNAATVGDILNVGWNLQGNGSAVDFVRHTDTVNFIDGKGSTVVAKTDDNKTSTVQINTAFDYTDEAGNSLVKVGGKFYKPSDVENGAPKAGAQEVTNPKVSLVNAGDNSTTTPAQLGNIAEGTKTLAGPVDENGTPLVKVGDKFYKAGDINQQTGQPNDGVKPVDVNPDAYNGLADLENSNPTNVMTVADAKKLGWVVSADGNDYADDVRNANEVKFKGGKGIEVKGETNGNTREITIALKEGEVVPTNEFTNPDDNKTYVKVGDNTYYNKDDIDPATGKPKENAQPVSQDVVNKLENKGDNFVTGNKVADAIQKSGFIVGKQTDTTGINFNNQDEKVNPNDNVRFADGKNTKVSLGTTKKLDKNGQIVTTTTIKVDADFPIDYKYTNKAGDELVKVGDKFYNAGDVVDGKPNDNATAVAPADVKTNAKLTDNNNGPAYTVNPDKDKLVNKERPVAGTGGINLNNVAWADKPDQAVNKDQLDQTVNKAGWDLLENGTKKDKVQPNDKVNFVNGRGTTVKIETSDDKVTSVVKIDSPFDYTDENGDPLTRIGDKFYKPTDINNQTGKPNPDAQPVAPKLSAVNLGDSNSTTNPVQLGNIAPGTNTLGPVDENGSPLVKVGDNYYKPADINEATGQPKDNAQAVVPKKDNSAYTGLADLTTSNPSNAMTVADARKLGWVVGTPDNEYEHSVRNAEKVNFKGADGINIKGSNNATTGVYDIELSLADASRIELEKLPKSGAEPEPTGKVTLPEGDTGNGFVSAKTVITAINGSGWKATSGAVDGGEVDGTTEELINPGETVTYQAGKNMKVKQQGNVFTYSTKDDVTFNSVATNNLTVGGQQTDPSKPASPAANISVVEGPATLEGKEGDKLVRIQYQPVGKDGKPQGKPEQLATLNDGLRFTGDDGKEVKRPLNSTLAVKGGAKGGLTDNNIGVTADPKTGALNVKLAKDIDLGPNGSIKAGPVKIGSQGINAGGTRITNVAPGKDPTDAVNVSQLKGAINNVNKGYRAGIAGANAAAGLPQVYIPGKSMVAASAGTFRGQGAIAVGYSRASDNGKLLLKIQGNTNTQGDVGGSVGLGYQW